MTLSRALFSSAKQDWETPPHIFGPLDREFKFTLDAAASPQSAKCKQFLTIDDGPPDADKWRGHNVWINPPYGRGIGAWVEQAFRAHRLGALVVMLLPARTDTRWFHSHIYNKPSVEIRLLRGRIKFVGAPASAPFPSMIVIFRGQP
jgi:phage N-6-adenine-methyltransferase